MYGLPDKSRLGRGGRGRAVPAAPLRLQARPSRAVERHTYTPPSTNANHSTRCQWGRPPPSSLSLGPALIISHPFLLALAWTVDPPGPGWIGWVHGGAAPGSPRGQGWAHHGVAWRGVAAARALPSALPCCAALRPALIGFHGNETEVLLLRPAGPLFLRPRPSAPPRPRYRPSPPPPSPRRPTSGDNPARLPAAGQGIQGWVPKDAVAAACNENHGD